MVHCLRCSSLLESQSGIPGEHRIAECRLQSVCPLKCCIWHPAKRLARTFFSQHLLGGAGPWGHDGFPFHMTDLHFPSLAPCLIRQLIRDTLCVTPHCRSHPCRQLLFTNAMLSYCRSVPPLLLPGMDHVHGLMHIQLEPMYQWMCMFSRPAPSFRFCPTRCLFWSPELSPVRYVDVLFCESSTFSCYF